MKASGSSQNTSIRAEVIPSFVGLSQPLFAGSPTKKGAPAISSPATDPRFHSSTAPSARMYHATASGALGTATITEIRGGFAKLSCRLTRSEEHTSELQSRLHLVCRLLLEKKKNSILIYYILIYDSHNVNSR